MSADTTPRFSVSDAIAIARDHYAVAAEALPLPSERDQNFKLTTAAGDMFVLKIAKSDEERAVLDMQNAVIKHIARHAPDIQIQRLVSAASGMDMLTVEDKQGRTFLVRLMTWLDGDLLVKVPQHSDVLLASLGATLADLDRALRGFSHQGMHRQLHWDLKLANLAFEHVSLLAPEQQSVVKRFVDAWKSIKWEGLRHNLIHGDANDYNVLVSDNRVAGLLDFGDMVYSAVVCDVAIAAAYAMLGKPEPVKAASTILRAYHARFPLTVAEIEALYPLITARLCMSICHAAYNARAKAGDAYQLVTAGPAWSLLKQLADIPDKAVCAEFIMVCGIPDSPEVLVSKRRRLLAGNLRLSYKNPVNVVRGSMQYLYDYEGRRYIDAYNNVPHVGHCHPRVLEAAQAQMAVLNTNTRYLSDLVVSYAERLTAKSPAPLDVCFFVNSGSEANELALRLARAHTGQRDLIVLEHAYHGNTTTLVDISPYKHNGPGGKGSPSWVHVAELPDLYRGPYKRGDSQAGAKYARSVIEIVSKLRTKNIGLSGFIAESWPSVGGQMDFPPGYLPAVYDAVRACGGVCIADEVQTGYGRLGTHFWGFEAYGVVPDIVVLGKPIGNGHPIGAVITTREIAASFDNGMEFFSTFGGNTVSAAIGRAVLDVVEEESLHAHALDVGEHLLKGLRALQARYPLIGDVRGSGLFLGVELVRDRTTLEPATVQTSALVNGLRERAILVGTEGAANNVLKIRPPMPFTLDDADELLEEMGAVFEEIGF